MPPMASDGEEPSYGGWTEQSQVSFLLSLGAGRRSVPLQAFGRAGRARGRRDFRFAEHFRKLSDEREKTAKIKYFPEKLKILK